MLLPPGRGLTAPWEVAVDFGHYQTHTQLPFCHGRALGMWRRLAKPQVPPLSSYQGQTSAQTSAAERSQEASKGHYSSCKDSDATGFPQELDIQALDSTVVILTTCAQSWKVDRGGSYGSHVQRDWSWTSLINQEL